MQCVWRVQHSVHGLLRFGMEFTNTLQGYFTDTGADLLNST